MSGPMEQPPAPAEEFDRFFVRTRPRMLARAVLMTGHRQTAEDAVQDAYTEALRHWHRIASYDSAEAWVHKVMTQRVWAAGRRGRRQLPSGLDVPLPPHPSVERTAEVRETLGALAGLPPAQRAAVVLHCLEGLTQEETAQRLGVTRGTVASAVHSARRTLARVLGLSEEHGTADQHLVATAAPGPALLPADRLALRLRNAEEWLRDGWESDRATGHRPLTEVRRGAAEEGAGERVPPWSRWLRRRTGGSALRRSGRADGGGEA
ncbi:RNA polymerase sigma factor [Streptomyces sp. NPDC001922]|uniref:RNA polymerase sigma factor n=1 Tax=Streptomyces sp. NPDC001922 TaxID=3364624 RepID=UPI0036B31583